MSEQIAASPMPKFRSPPDPLVSTRRLNRRQVMAVVRLRIEIGSGNDAAVAAAQTAVGPLWPALQSLAEFQREDVVRRRQSPGAWARIVVAIDLLVEYYAAIDAAARQSKQAPGKPRLAAVPPAPAPQTRAVPTRAISRSVIASR